ncbi:hypothetical protein [uncultured Butyricimonas sp.]|uniref:hypothetical protein n=1 Tax=uncultured Butyricimonas sp. TaxID=1268785 RepID=UPI0026DBA7DD|nr:hypothetical protein [uncultured Butyricimonas sp.]
MKNSILIGLFSLVFFSCNQEDDVLISNNVENELLVLKNKYGLKYQKQESTKIPENALSIDELKRFFTSFESQQSKSRYIARNDWEGHHYPNIEEAEGVSLVGGHNINLGSDSLWSSIKIYGETMLDDIDIITSCSFTRDIFENWPIPQDIIVRIDRNKQDCNLVDYAGDENMVLFFYISIMTFDVFEEAGNGQYIVWGIIWAFNISGYIDIQNNISEMNLTTTNYDESPDHFN